MGLPGALVRVGLIKWSGGEATPGIFAKAVHFINVFGYLTGPLPTEEKNGLAERSMTCLIVSLSL